MYSCLVNIDLTYSFSVSRDKSVHYIPLKHYLNLFILIELWIEVLCQVIQKMYADLMKTVSDSVMVVIITWEFF